MFDIQQSGTANRLKNPIAVISSLAAFVHLCEHAKVNPNNNDLFVLVRHPVNVEKATYSRVIELDGADDLPHLLRIRSDCRAAIRN